MSRSALVISRKRVFASLTARKSTLEIKLVVPVPFVFSVSMGTSFLIIWNKLNAASVADIIMLMCMYRCVSEYTYSDTGCA